MTAFLKLSRAIDSLNERLGKTVAWAIVVAILVSAINAIIRRVFGVSSNAWLELQWYLFGAVFMLCSPWTLKVNEHIRIDIVSNMLSKRTRNWIDLLGHVFFLFPFVAIMLWLCVPYFQKSYLSGEVSSNAGGLLIWPAKGLILLGFFFLGLQWLSELIKRIAIMRGDLDDETTNHSAEAEAERLLTELGDPNTATGGEPPGDGIR
ncbi:TRAP transporter small permease subunit [Microvirga sp. 17 mud 1-3]|uniref:TRAP transporter small permease subunit n=1 Tax=Microvirga sp. 17 mud 1-3 TaxID=2082949 RepID=UPI000D6B75E6|nr:TRAP transporter small permease subunit [Microvirga sp. 17 mud 1-3]AWM86928.1 C4-dicarboxylate ABC transporter [Microvirga sp. 17 mud 1-3]